jgi:acyl-CoA thioester hydrolase
MPSNHAPHQSHHTPIHVRFADTDALGHVNNASFAQYAEAARLDFFKQLGVDVTSIILARLAIDFRSQVRYGDALHVETQIERLGRSSINLLQLVLAGDQVVAEMRTVVVLFDYDQRRPQEIPASLRQQLSVYTVPSQTV